MWTLAMKKAEADRRISRKIICQCEIEPGVEIFSIYFVLDRISFLASMRKISIHFEQIRGQFFVSE